MDECLGADDDKVDEGGLPVHLPMPINSKGEGPVGNDEDDDEIAAYVCWCPDSKCTWTQALEQAYRLGVKHGGGQPRDGQPSRRPGR